MIGRFLQRFRRTPSCDHVMEVLQAYLDGEVSGDEAARVAVHLEACRACATESDVYDRIKSSLAVRRRPIDPQIRGALEAFTRDLQVAED